MAFFNSINNFSKMYNYNSGPTDNYETRKYAMLPKLHGTNASIHIDGNEITAYSKNRKLKLNDDNHGFANHVETVSKLIRERLGGQLMPSTLYGEWCGQGIHSGAQDMVCQLPERKFFVFAVRIGEEVFTDFSDIHTDLEEIGFVPVLPLYMEAVPFQLTPRIHQVVTKLNQTVLELESTDKFISGMYPELEGNGEGVVGVLWPECSWEDYFKYAFKAKTEAHRVKATKQAVSVSEPLPEDALKFCATFATKARLTQAVSELGLTYDMRNTKAVLEWFVKDVEKESKEEVLAMGVQWTRIIKTLNPYVVKLWKDEVALAEQLTTEDILQIPVDENEALERAVHSLG